MTTKAGNPRIWILSELYYPEDSATGHLLTQIAESLAESAKVSVLCVKPYANKLRQKAPRFEVHNGVEIYRCWSTSFSKDRIFLRLINMLTVLFSIGWHLLIRIRKNDQILVVTNPPVLPFVASLICKLRGAKCNLLIHDVYPDVLVPTNFLKENSFQYKLFSFIVLRLYLAVDQIITIGRDMERRLIAKSERLRQKTMVIPNWCDDKMLEPITDPENRIRSKLQLDDKFVVQYSGNIGRTHGLLSIADAAKILELQYPGQIHWLVCGEGAGKQAFADRCKEFGLTSVTIMPFFERDELPLSLRCGDVGIISFIAGMSGISVPSRMYNFFAVGCPLIGVTEQDSELALVLSEHQIGWVVPPENSQKLAEQVSELFQQRHELPALRARCQKVAQTHFTREHAIRQYRKLLIP